MSLSSSPFSPNQATTSSAAPKIAPIRGTCTDFSALSDWLIDNASIQNRLLLLPKIPRAREGSPSKALSCRKPATRLTVFCTGWLSSSSSSVWSGLPHVYDKATKGGTPGVGAVAVGSSLGSSVDDTLPAG